MAGSNGGHALLDYGGQPIEFGSRVPLGVNMAFTRAAFERAGGFDPNGRRAGTLLGQESANGASPRKSGVRGFYIPEMGWNTSSPPIAAQSYFRRWFLARDQPGVLVRASGIAWRRPSQPPSIFPRCPYRGVPRYMYRRAVTN